VKRYIPFIAIIFALSGIIFTYEWMFQGHDPAYLNSLKQQKDIVSFPKSLVASPKLITWLILMVIKTTSYFVLFPYLLYKLFNSGKLIWRKKDYIIFTIIGVSLLEFATRYGSTVFAYLRYKSFPSELISFGEQQNLISWFWGIIAALLFALIFQYPFKLNEEMKNYETKLFKEKDETAKTGIKQQHIINISRLKKSMDSLFYLLGFIVALSELSYAALREAAIEGHSPAYFPIEVVYYHGLFQSLLIAIVYIPFSYYFNLKLQAIEYKASDEYSKQLQLATDFKLNPATFKKIVPIISPLIGSIIPALFDAIFS
jgi:hypothetical protein